MLELNDIHTYYGESYILQGVTLRVERGEAVALMGRNGVGKTTTIRSIVGFTPPRRGKIIFQDKPIQALRATTIARLGVGLVPQGRRIFPNLTVRENLLIAARGGAKGGWTEDEIYKYFPRLKERAGNMGNQLSGGEQQMLAIGRALMTNPEILLLDEPSEGLAPMVLHEIAEIIARLREKGLAILLVEQNVKMALNIAGRVYVMNKGRIAWEGTSTELWENEEVMHQHLGV
jgi:branched-chain amino acid transport system ATP-binding protein